MAKPDRTSAAAKRERVRFMSRIVSRFPTSSYEVGSPQFRPNEGRWYVTVRDRRTGEVKEFKGRDIRNR